MRNIERATEGQASQLDLEQTLGFGVYDKENNHIGELTALWTDHTGQPAFIGVRTNWLFGKTHVVPAQGVEVNLADRRVRIPFYEGDVKEAPCFDPEEELDSTREEQVYAYYGMQGRAQPSISGSASEAPAEARGAEEVRIPLREEQVRVGKRSVDTGGVRLRKIVRTERINQPVELQKEEIVVERVPGREGAAATGEAFQEQEIYIPLRREEAVVEKETRVREEVLARKQTRTEQQTVSESVRKEDVETDDDTARGERSKAEALRREGQGEGSGPCGES